MDEIGHFVKKYPHGSTVQLPEEVKPKPLRHFIPQHYYRALSIEWLINLAKERGYSEADRAKIREMLGPQVEPVLISLDDIYGKEEE